MRLAANVSPVAVAAAAAVTISVPRAPSHLEAIAICSSTINSSLHGHGQLPHRMMRALRVFVVLQRIPTRHTHVYTLAPDRLPPPPTPLSAAFGAPSGSH